MNPLRLPLERIVPAPDDLAVLRGRALRLSNGAASSSDFLAAPRLVVRFSLGGRPWALEIDALQRAVARLGRIDPLQVDGHASRFVTFLEEEPLPVFDLAEATGRARTCEELARSPALVLEDAEGPIACAVEGPLDLAELALTHSAGALTLRALSLPLAGQLSDGALLLDGGGLRKRAGSAIRGS